MKSYITSIGQAVPAYRTPQQQIAGFMSEAAGMNAEESGRLNLLYRASGIRYRHSVIPDFGKENGQYEFFSNTTGLEPFPTVGQRMQVYEQEALPLALMAVQDCVERNSNDSVLSEITHIITVSCTGMYAPGLDIGLIERLNLSKNIQRICINFMGCYAAFNGIKIADAICRSQPEAKVLMVCVELCTIHYQKTKNWDQILSNALFSDGAAAIIVEGKKPERGIALSLENFYCDLAPEGKKDMAWQIADFGFEMVLSSYVPSLIKGGIRMLTERLLSRFELEVNEIDYYAIHPGGKKILEVIEEELSLDHNKNRFAYHVLREYGNMSSPTILFVLKQIMEELGRDDHDKNILSFAFGPGLTLESMLLRVHSFGDVEKTVNLQEALIEIS